MTHHLLAIHGAGMHGGVFGSLAPLLTAQSFEAVTLPGHRPGDAADLLLPSVSAMAQWLLGRIETHPQESLILIGHSLGAAVALAAARHPRVAGVVALGAAPTLPVNQQLLDLAGQDSAAAQSLVVKWSCDPAHPQTETIRAQTAAIMAQVPGAALAVDLAACASLQELPPVQKPVLVISGSTDKMTPPERGAALAALQGGGQVVIQGGHMLLLEHPLETAAAIGDFIGAL